MAFTAITILCPIRLVFKHGNITKPVFNGFQRGWLKNLTRSNAMHLHGPRIHQRIIAGVAGRI